MPAFMLRWVGICLASFLFQACSPEAVLPNVSLEQAQSEPEAGKVLMIDVREPLVHATGVRNPGQADQREWAKRGWPMVKPQDLVVPAKS